MTGELTLDAGLTASKAWGEIARVLREGGVEQPVIDARLLVCHALGTDRLGLLRDPYRPLADAAAALDAAVRRRLDREPVSRIVGARAFWGRSFRISPATLDPRPDSETLVAAALEVAATIQAARPDKHLRLIDLGTGSGCLLLSLLAELPEAEGVGTDISGEALDVARANAADLGLDSRARFVAADWGQAVTGPFDLIISNPPYIPHGDIAGLAPEVTQYDPLLALDGGPDGLDAYRAILANLPSLPADGAVLFEVGIGQAAAVQDLLTAAFDGEARSLESRRFHRWQDLSEIERVVGVAT